WSQYSRPPGPAPVMGTRARRGTLLDVRHDEHEDVAADPELHVVGQDLLVDAFDVDEGPVGGAQVAQDRGLAEDVHGRVLAGRLGVVEVDVGAGAAERRPGLRDLVDLSGGGALDDGQGIALVGRELERAHAMEVAAGDGGAAHLGGLGHRLLRVGARPLLDGGGRRGRRHVAGRGGHGPHDGILGLGRAAAPRAARLDLGPTAELVLVELVARLAARADDDHPVRLPRSMSIILFVWRRSTRTRRCHPRKVEPESARSWNTWSGPEGTLGGRTPGGRIRGTGEEATWIETTSFGSTKTTNSMTTTPTPTTRTPNSRTTTPTTKTTTRTRTTRKTTTRRTTTAATARTTTGTTRTRKKKKKRKSDRAMMAR